MTGLVQIITTSSQLLISNILTLIIITITNHYHNNYTTGSINIEYPNKHFGSFVIIVVIFSMLFVLEKITSNQYCGLVAFLFMVFFSFLTSDKYAIDLCNTGGYFISLHPLTDSAY